MPTQIDTLRTALADRYRIERELGMGGMATVYLADDIKHDRKVALKVLKPELAAVLGADRFVVEIKTTASLQHPHILPLFDSGTANGFLYYVMPFIEGETLRDKLNRESQLGIDDAVRIAREVADALDYAHRHGVIHRDIKPENILLHDGRPMVADFGIALAVSAAAGGRMTETGLSLGTPHYMSPEQATAEKEITARADVYSLASVLYEMLAGEPPHVGGSAQQIIMKIIAEPVQPVTNLRKSVPPNVAAALVKALEKLPADRFDSAKAFANALIDASFTTTAFMAPESAIARKNRTRTLVALGALSVVLAVVAVAGWMRAAPEQSVLRYVLPNPFPVAAMPDMPVPTPSPDGSFIVFHGPGATANDPIQLWIKRRGDHAAKPIPGTAGATTFAISPDGASIAFDQKGQIKTMTLAGGPAVTIADGGGEYGITWLDDGTIVYAPIHRAVPHLWSVAATGGDAKAEFPDDTLGTAVPEAIPGRRAVLYDRCTAASACDVWALDLDSRKTSEVVRGVTWAQYATTGHVVYVKDGHLLALPFDAASLTSKGTAVPLLDSIAGDLVPIRLSRSGTLITRHGASTASSYEAVFVDRSGNISPVDTAWRFRLAVTGNNHGWSLSRDGKRLAIGLNTGAGDDIWVKDLPRGAVSRVTYDSAPDFRPRWTPDSRSVTFVSARTRFGIYMRRADGGGEDSLLFGGLNDEAVMLNDNASLLIRRGATGGATGRDIVRAKIGTDTNVTPIVVSKYEEDAITISPDGKWIAYQSDETGKTEVFLKSYPATNDVKKQISNGGGAAPLWSRDGKELFFLSAKHDMMSVRVSSASASAISLSEPAVLFRVPDALLAVEYAFYTPWDIGPDGRFIMVRQAATISQGTVTVVAENWLSELTAKVKR